MSCFCLLLVDSEVVGRGDCGAKKMIKVFLATKFGVNGLADGTRIFSNEPEYIENAIDKSLERLQTDHVDLWYWFVHLPSPLHMPLPRRRHRRLQPPRPRDANRPL